MSEPSKQILHKTLRTLAASLNRPHDLPWIGSTKSQIIARIAAMKKLKPKRTSARVAATPTMSRAILWNNLKIQYATQKTPKAKRLKWNSATKAKIKNALAKFIITISWDAVVIFTNEEFKSTISNSLNVSSINNIEGQARRDFKTYMNDYTKTYELVDFEFKSNKTPLLSLEETHKRMVRHPLNAVIYKIDNARVSEEQDNKNCMLNYILREANKRRDDINDIEISDIETILNKTQSELYDGISVEETEKICRSLDMGCRAVMMDKRILCDFKACYSGLMFVVQNDHCYPISDKCRRSFAQSFSETIKWANVAPVDETEIIGEYSDLDLDKIIDLSFNPYTEPAKPKAEIKTLERPKAIPRPKGAKETQEQREARVASNKATRALFSIANKAAKKAAKIAEKAEKARVKNVNKKLVLVNTAQFSRTDLINIMADTKCQFSIKSYGRKIKKLKIGLVKIQACPDKKHTIEFCDIFNIAQKGKSLPTLAKELFEKKFKAIPQSYLNSETRKIIYSVKPTAINVKFSELRGDERGVDIIRCYTRELTRYQQFPVYASTDYPERFSGVVQVGKYYVETDDVILMRGNGWYSHELVQYALNKNIIYLDEIKYELIPQYKINASKFYEFKQLIYSKLTDKTAKKVLNFFVGCLGIKDESNDVNLITSSENEALSFLASADKSSIKTHYHSKNLHHVRVRANIKTMETNCPLYQQVVDNGRIAVHKLYCRLKNVVGIKTDCVVFRDGYYPKFGTKPGEYRKEDLDNKEFYLNHCPTVTALYDLPENNYTLRRWSWNTRDHTDAKFNDQDLAFLERGGCLDGFAGTGKSWIINNRINKDFERMAFSNTAANNINGKTFHSTFKMTLDDNMITPASVKKLVGRKFVIDEYSMIPENIICSLSQLKENDALTAFICSGDSRQIQFIPRNTNNKNLRLNKEIPRLSETFVFAELCHFNKTVLNYCHRADAKFSIDLTKDLFEQHEGDFGKAGVHITVTNAMRISINNEMVEADTGHIVYKSDQLTLKQNTPWIAKTSDKALKISKNEFMTLIAYEKKNKLIVLKSEFGNEVRVKVSKFKGLFNLRYAMTVNKLQGKTLTENFIIHEWNHYFNDIFKMYTACSRATHSGQYIILNDAASKRHQDHYDDFDPDDFNDEMYH